jgi:hypothetical protein
MIRKSMLRLTGVILPLVAAAHMASAQTTAAAVPATALPLAATLMSKFAAAVGGPAYMSAKAIVSNPRSIRRSP